MATVSSNNTKKEKSLVELFLIVYRRKMILISSTILFLILAFLYNEYSTPEFESSAVLKKENTNQVSNELVELVQLQTQDQIGTEMELIKTDDVLGRVIDKLKLDVELKKIIDPVGNSYELNNVFIDFPDSGNNYAKQIGFSLPIFKDLELKNKNTELELYIEKKSENLFELWEVEKNKLILSAKTTPVNKIDTLNGLYSTNTLDSTKSLTLNGHSRGAIFNTDFAQFEFSWDDAPVGSKIYFNIDNFYKFLMGFSKAIYVTGGGTSLFTLHVRSSSPHACKVIASNIIDSFRDARMEQQKQTVRYSFKFVDQQLTEIQSKLLDAENKLSDFKASGHIMTIDAQTAGVMDKLSTLEAEKLQAELLLANYKDKAEAMKKELESSGYFDQSFLESVEPGANSAYNTLMSQLSDLEMKRLELLLKRTEKHPDVINLDDQIRAVKDKLGSFNQNTLASYKVMINIQEKKLQKIASLMSDYNAKMQTLPEQENKMERLVRERDVYKKIFTLLLDKREEMRVAELSKLQDIILIDPPSEPIKAIRPRKFFNMVVASCIGGFIGIVSIFLIELSKTRLINLDDLEEEFKIPIFALIPKYDKDIVKRIKNPADEKDRFVALMVDNLGIRESYRLLKTKLFYHFNGKKFFLVTSCEEHTGKTSIVANLAITLAIDNNKVLIIDCDLRKAELTKMFDVPLNSPGLIEFITKGGSPAIYTKVLKKIDIIPTGGVNENSSSLLSSDQMKSLFDAIDTAEYEYIIVDTPPVTRVVDTLVLGQYVKDAILVVKPDTSMKEVVIGGIQEMNQAKIKIRGIVANAAEIEKSYYYRYRYGYGYGYSSGKNGKGNKDISMNIINKVKKNKITSPTNFNIFL